MLCYRDRTYCVSPDCKDHCGRKLTPEIVQAADKWWGKGKHEAPIAVSCFCGGSFEEATANLRETHDYKADEDA